MKHYKELSDIETVIINLEVLTSTVRVLTFGVREANRRDVEYTFHNITDQLNMFNAILREKFDILFDAVREEDKKDEKQDEV